jgi:uncharacterized protein Yka (UPF0111/DUF47 family)
VLQLLTVHAESVGAGMEALARWAGGADSEEAAVRQHAREADGTRRAVLVEVKTAFVSDVSPEDAFELAERLTEVMKGAKNLVREAEVLALPPDRAMADMAGHLAAGVTALVRGLRGLPDAGHATEAADQAVASLSKVESVYRVAMSSLLSSADLRDITARRELYRRMVRIGDRVVSVGDRIWYAVVKEQ